MKPILYFSHWCSDTEPFATELERFGIDYEPCDITKCSANFKPFLRLRDRHAAFDHAKENGYIGIPALVWKDDVYLDPDELESSFK
ncbi:hypothetical protein NYR85_07755 [Actinobacillus equuli subsp. equuli]|nr:hypothetical protein [Actinobacillus equuli]MDG4953095.1 hypothetical protein [Actinobacillus equuli subsp. equuli]